MEQLKLEICVHLWKFQGGCDCSLTGGAERQVKPTVEIELDAADVRFHFQRRDRMFHVCVPQLHCTTTWTTTTDERQSLFAMQAHTHTHLTALCPGLPG